MHFPVLLVLSNIFPRSISSIILVPTDKLTIPMHLFGWIEHTGIGEFEIGHGFFLLAKTFRSCIAKPLKASAAERVDDTLCRVVFMPPTRTPHPAALRATDG